METIHVIYICLRHHTEPHHYALLVPCIAALLVTLPTPNAVVSHHTTILKSPSAPTSNSNRLVALRRSTSVGPSAVAGVRQPPPAFAPGVPFRESGIARHNAASIANAAVPLYPGSHDLNCNLATAVGVDAFAPWAKT